MSFMMVSLFLYFVELQSGTLSLTSVLTQLLIFIVYSITVYSMDKQQPEKDPDPRQNKKDGTRGSLSPSKQSLIPRSQDLAFDVPLEEPEVAHIEEAPKSKNPRSPYEACLHWMEDVCFLIIVPLKTVLPYKNWPVITVAFLFIVTYYMVEFIVTVLNVFSAYTGMSHFIVGMTLMVWGSDTMEMLSLAIAIGIGEEEMATIAVLSCQILCLTLVVPVACLSRMLMREEFEIQVMQAHHNRGQLIVPVMILILVVFSGYIACNMHLNRKCVLLFAASYVSYIIYSCLAFQE